MEWPLELVEGFVGSIEVAVPWAALLTDHCTILVSGLQLTLQPRHGPGEGGREWERSGGRGPGLWRSRASSQDQGLLTRRAGPPV